MWSLQNKFFEILGRVLVIVLALVAVAGVAFYYGTQKGADEASKKTELNIVTSETNSPDTIDSTGTKVAKATVSTVQISSGAANHTQYTVTVPSDWQATKDPSNSSDMDKLTLTKNGYTVVIYQANMGGSMYSFKDAKVDGPFAQEYSGTYSDFTGASGEKYRRIDSSSQNKPGEKSFGVLVFGVDVYQTPTTFGGLSYTTPLSPGKDMLDEMDSIISSLKKQLYSAV